MAFHHRLHGLSRCRGAEEHFVRQVFKTVTFRQETDKHAMAFAIFFDHRGIGNFVSFQECDRII
jgi:hypothetical protein